ncbi:hypothetical protein H6P81_008650 [Aristolochia fimbriata]|uniref:Uncharacterized protein n=1 Tax=Aristolochia fimbriata TaxID=158543 RepID=A0AAV7EIM6_ARIFI|nr:hypothetical protein H6P81_008650 [Aristolochia fimbriata]
MDTFRRNYIYYFVEYFNFSSLHNLHIFVLYYDPDWIKHREPPTCHFRYWVDEFVPLTELPAESPKPPVEPGNLDNVLVHYSVKFINELKARTTPATAKFSRFDVLTGHLWKKITTARGLDPEEISQVRIAINGRPRLRSLSVPPMFFGNLVLNAFPRAKVRCLEEFSVTDSAQLVHDSVTQIGDAYFRSFIDFGAMH